LGRVFDEANMIVERENSRIITDAQLIQLAVAGILSQKARTAFTKQIKALNIVTKPIRALFEWRD
tara:strand:- start:115 stop:309 length:195 start_codon:yes stop_codon:yes gene_type:complete